MSKVETSPGNLDIERWPTSTFEQRDLYSWPTTNAVRAVRGQSPTSRAYLKTLGSALLFSSVLSLGLGAQLRQISESGTPRPTAEQPVKRNVVTFGPEIDPNNISVTQGEGVQTELLILERAEGDSVVPIGITVSGEHSDPPIVTTEGTKITVNFPSKTP